MSDSLPLHRILGPAAMSLPLTLVPLHAQSTPETQSTPENPAPAPNGASAEPTLRELRDRLEAQDRRIAELEGERSQAEGSSQQSPGAGLTASYDNGFRLRSVDPDSPFDLRINGRMQFRYAGFDSDSGGMTSATPNDRNDFEIERGRLEFRGTFIDRHTHFYINIDADTDDNHSAIFHDFWVNHEFCDGFDLYVGKAFVPGSRDWLSGSTGTHLADRSMATTFFRPDRSLGIWAIGEPVEDLHYRVMVANGFNTTDLESATSAGSQIDTKFAYAASVWWDPLADYGKGYADLEQHEQLAVRVGATVTYAPEEDGQLPANQEADAIRLSDGSRLTSLMVESFDLKMAAFDAAMKYQGLSINSELFWREIDSVSAPTMPTVPGSFYDWGGYCDVGYMVVPHEFEVVARFSTVQGSIRDSHEYAGGVNWYVDGTHLNKLTVDASKLDGSPTSNSGPNYRAGDDGWMFRIQWQIAF